MIDKLHSYTEDIRSTYIVILVVPSCMDGDRLKIICRDVNLVFQYLKHQN